MSQLRVIAFGAHPDDCDIRAGGTAALWSAMGHAVKFVSITNGDAGHHRISCRELAARRREESLEAGRRLGVEYQVLDYPDGQLVPSLEARNQVIRLIRDWKADLVLGPRPNDYHPDHRYTAVLVQDAAYLVVVPALVPDSPALAANPVFLYYEDRFQRPNPFRPDIAVVIDDVVDRKVGAVDAHGSQFYEWLPWVEGHSAEVPAAPSARLQWLQQTRIHPASGSVREATARWYGAEKGARAQFAEAFEICEYGCQPDEQRIRQLFPMLPPA